MRVGCETELEDTTPVVRHFECICQRFVPIAADRNVEPDYRPARGRDRICAGKKPLRRCQIVGIEIDVELVAPGRQIKKLTDRQMVLDGLPQEPHCQRCAGFDRHARQADAGIAFHVPVERTDRGLERELPVENIARMRPVRIALRQQEKPIGQVVLLLAQKRPKGLGDFTMTAGRSEPPPRSS